MVVGQMSRDRVHFSVPFRRLENSKYRRLLTTCFGLKDREIPNWNGTYNQAGFKIICRPSQFARFIILRNQWGIDNMVKELSPVLKMETMIMQNPIEVWDRPNNVGAG